MKYDESIVDCLNFKHTNLPVLDIQSEDMRPSIAELFRFCDSEFEEMFANYLHFLRFPTVGADPNCSHHMQACAEWLVEFLSASGFCAELWETADNPPIVFGQRLDAGPDKPTVLFYGHYDVQPVDPLELWHSPPFEPKVIAGNVFARGAQDNKGQCIYFLHALRSMLRRDGSLPLNVKVCIEGQEELGSKALQEIVEDKSTLLQADHLVVVDSFLKDAHSPSVSLGTRGSTLMTVEFTGSVSDLHSGMHGGLAYNPNHALIEVLGKMRDISGRVTVPGFYDDVITPQESELEALCLDFDALEYERIFGAKPVGGERAFSPVHSNYLRPTLEINGIAGGYSGEGFKMVIPAKATAKISARLVPNQNPDHIAELIAGFIRRNLPEGIAAAISIGAGGRAVRTSPASPLVRASSSAFSAVMGKPCKLVLDGVTIPPASKLTSVSGAEAVFIGYGLPTDNIHAPDEHFGLDRLRLGFVTVSRLLQTLGESCGN